MKTIAIIQARMSSSRLPGKILMDICGKPMLSRVVDRVSKAKTLSEVVVATTDEPQDQPVAEFCKTQDIRCFRGNHLDVLDRYFKAALKYKAEAVVRVTSDCPLIDPELIDRVVNEFTRQHPSIDYISNVQAPRTFPRGLDVEVFSFTALNRAWKEASDKFFREHVTTYLYNHPDVFNVTGVAYSSDESKRRWTVDTEADLQLVREIYKVMGDNDFSWLDVMKASQSHPEWASINGHVEQKVA